MNSQETIHGQISMLPPDELYDVQVMQEVDGHVIPFSYGHEGSYVDTVTRAQYLINALNAMSQRNIRKGISVAAYTPVHSAPIWARYQSATTGVLDGASRNREIAQEDLRTNFWRATGFAAMRGMQELYKIMPPQQINPRAQKMWDDFNDDYGNSRKVKARNAYKKQLSQQLTVTHDEQLKLVA